MELLQYFSEHHEHLFYLLAGISFIIELGVMGLSGPLLFFAIAASITGLLISNGVISGWEIEFFATGILTAVVALLLWKPLKRFQNTSDGVDTSSDMIGQEVLVSKAVTLTGGSIRHSGIDWNARLDANGNGEVIEHGQRCVITAVQGNVMIVKALGQ